MVKKRFPPSEYGASYPDLGIASELRPFSLTSGHVFTTNALGTNRPSRKAWPDEAGREGGEREVGRGVAVAGRGHSDRSCSQAGLQRTKGDGATISHETGEGGKERERVRERGGEREGGERELRERGERERERERRERERERGERREERGEREGRGRGREILFQFYRIQFESLVLVLSTRAYECLCLPKYVVKYIKIMYNI